MTKVTVDRIEKLNEDVPERRLSNHTWASTLASIRVKAVLMPGSSDYDALVNSVCQKALPILHQARHEGYNLCLFLVGPKLSSERKAKIVNYSLSKPMRTMGISALASRERVYELPGGEVVAGLYVVNWDDFERYCLLLFRNSWSIGLLSKRLELSSVNKIDMLYKAAKVLNDELTDLDVNWISVSNLCCPLGDIILKTFGAFDDREREMNLIYDTKGTSLLHTSQSSA